MRCHVCGVERAVPPVHCPVCALRARDVLARAYGADACPDGGHHMGYRPTCLACIAEQEMAARPRPGPLPPRA